MKTAFLALSFHASWTKSSQFFITRLREMFGDVTVILDDHLWLEAPPALRDFLEEPVPGYRPRYHPVLVSARVARYTVRRIPGAKALYRLLRGLVNPKRQEKSAERVHLEA